MSVLAGLGAFAGGVAQGYSMGEKIDEIKQQRKTKEAQQAGFDAYLKTLQEREEPTIQVPTEGTQENKIGYGLDALPEVKAYADGGLVDTTGMKQELFPQQGLSAVQPQATQPQAQTRKRDPLTMATNLRDAYYAAAKAANDKGGSEAAMQFAQLGFKYENDIYEKQTKQEKARAMNAFDLTGDPSALIPIYNDQIPDGHKVVAHEQLPDGKYKFVIQTPKGTEVEQTYSKDDILGMVSQIDDPATRFAIRAKSLLVQQNKKFETDEKIRADKEIENNKTHSYGLDNVVVKGDQVLYDGSKREKPGAWKDDYLSLGGGTYLKKNADGTQAVMNTPSKKQEQAKPIKYDDVNEAVLGYEGMGTMSDTTGKIVPTKAGNEALIFGQRLFKQNPDMPPADIARLAAEAATNPNATDYEVIERADGTRYKRQVIKYGDNIYRLGTSSSIPNQAPKSQKPKQPTEKQNSGSGGGLGDVLPNKQPAKEPTNPGQIIMRGRGGQAYQIPARRGIPEQIISIDEAKKLGYI